MTVLPDWLHLMQATAVEGSDQRNQSALRLRSLHILPIFFFAKFDSTFSLPSEISVMGELPLAALKQMANPKALMLALVPQYFKER